MSSDVNRDRRVRDGAHERHDHFDSNLLCKYMSWCKGAEAVHFTPLA